MNSTGLQMGPRASRWSKVAWVAIVMLAAVAGGTQVWDSDVPQHLASGQWMLQHGQILGLAADPFGVDGPRHFVNVHWLFQVVAALLYSLGGFAALSLLKAAAFAGVAAILMGWLSRRVSAGWLMLCGMLLVVALESRIRARPELFTFLLLAATLVLLESVRTGQSARRLWWLLPIHILWVNVHGLFVVGLAASWAMLAGAWIDRLLKRDAAAGNLSGFKALSPVLAATAAVFVVTPWPIEAALHPLLLSGRISGANLMYSLGVSEIMPTYLINPLGNLPVMVNLVIGVVVFQLLLSRIRQAPVGHWLWLGFFGLLAALAVRNVPLLGIPGVFLLALYGGTWLEGLKKDIPFLNALARGGALAMAGLCVLLAAGFATETFSYWQHRDHYRSGLGLALDSWPVQTARFLAGSGLSGDILPLEFGDGGTFDLYAGPQHKVWMDGRLEVNSAEKFQNLYELRAKLLSPAAADDPEQTPLPPTVRFVFVRYSDTALLDSLRRSDRFKLLYIEPVGVCFARLPAPGEQDAQLTAWSRQEKLPPANLEEYDRPMEPGRPLLDVPTRRHGYRQNVPSLHWQFGAMLFTLGLDDLAVRYLSLAEEFALEPKLSRVGLLAQAHQRLAEAKGMELDDDMPADPDLAGALALYEQLDLHDLRTSEAQSVALMRIRGMIYGRQVDAAWSAMEAYLADLPIPERWRPDKDALVLRDQIRQALRVAQTRRQQQLEGKDLSADARARLLLRKDIGLLDAAIAELAAVSQPDAATARLLGDLYLRKGLIEQARLAYALSGDASSPAMRLRAGLCDWAGGDFLAAKAQLEQAAPAPAGRLYLALLLEQMGYYGQAVGAIGPATATAPAGSLQKQMAQVRARLSASGYTVQSK